MAIDPTLTNVTSGYNLGKINENFDNIATALDDAVSRSGNSPNHMLADLDMNSNDLLNVNSINNVTYPNVSEANAAASAAAAALSELASTNLKEVQKTFDGYAGINPLVGTAVSATVSSHADGYLTVTATAEDPQVPIDQNVSIDGSKERYVAIGLLMTAGTIEGKLYYETSGHGYSDLHYIDFASAVSLNIDKTIVLDMWDLTVGGTDWKTNTITGLRVDVGSSANAVWNLKWLATLRDTPATSKVRPISVLSYGLEEGADGSVNGPLLEAGLTAEKSAVFPPNTSFNLRNVEIPGDAILQGHGNSTVVCDDATNPMFSFAIGAEHSCIHNMKLDMESVGNATAIELKGGNQYIDLNELNIDFDYNFSETDNIAIEAQADNGFNAHIRFANSNVQAAWYGLKANNNGTGVTNVVTVENVEYNACIRPFWDDNTNLSGGHSFHGSTLQFGNDSQTGVGGVNIHGLTWLGGWIETKKSGNWDARVATDFTTHTPFHFDNSCENILVMPSAIFPYSTKEEHFYSEGSRYFYLDPRGGWETDFIFDAKGGLDITPSLATNNGLVLNAMASQSVPLLKAIDENSNTNFGLTQTGVPYYRRNYQNHTSSGGITFNPNEARFHSVTYSDTINPITITTPTDGNMDIIIRFQATAASKFIGGWPTNITTQSAALPNGSGVNGESVIIGLTYEPSSDEWFEFMRKDDFTF